MSCVTSKLRSSQLCLERPLLPPSQPHQQATSSEPLRIASAMDALRPRCAIAEPPALRSPLLAARSSDGPSHPCLRCFLPTSRYSREPPLARLSAPSTSALRRHRGPRPAGSARRSSRLWHTPMSRRACLCHSMAQAAAVSAVSTLRRTRPSLPCLGAPIT